MSDEPEGLAVAVVTITRYLTEDDMVDHATATTADGYDLGLAEALGMLELAKFTLVESYADAGEDEE